MRGSRFSEEEVLTAVRRLESGENPLAVGQDLHVSESTLHRWRWKYGGVVNEERRVVLELEKQLHDTRAELRRINLENDALKELLAKKA